MNTLPFLDLNTCDVATIDALLAVAPCSPFLALLQENTLLNVNPSTVIGIITVPLSARVLDVPSIFSPKAINSIHIPLSLIRVLSYSSDMSSVIPD